MKLETQEIYTFKMNSGEEIVTRIVNIDDKHIEIEHPIVVALTPQGLQMMPGIFTSDNTKNVRLNTNSYSMVAETREDVRNNYIQATTGIVPATKQIVMG